MVMNSVWLSIRRISTSVLLNGKYMDSSASAKVANQPNRMIKKFVEFERRKLETLRKLQAIGAEEKREYERNYNKPHKYVIFEDSKKSLAFSRALEENLRMILTHRDMRQHFQNFDFTITKVRVHPSFKMLYVFWINNSIPSQDPAILKSLEEKGKDMRHELEVMSCLGKIPEIKFVKDLDYIRQRILNETFDKVKNSMSVEEKPLENYEEYLENNNSLSFNSIAVMSQIKQAMEKARAEHREESKVQKSRHANHQDNSVQEGDDARCGSRKKYIREFLVQRNKDFKQLRNLEIKTNDQD